MTLLINTMFITLSSLILVLVTLSDTVAQDFEPEQVYCGTARELDMAAEELRTTHPANDQLMPILPDVRTF